MTRAALYLRQSLDRDNRQEGINRQRERCRALAELRGWEVVDEYLDNDVSASKPRAAGTAWHRLTTEGAEHVDVLIAVDLDRLLRTQRDLITLIDLGVKLVTVDGEIDLATADGEFRATMATALARFEVARKSERQKRANAHGRSLGVPSGGGRRAFGYSPLAKGARSITATRIGADGRSWPAYGHEPIEPEATAVRRGFDLLLSGVSLRSIAREWNDAGLVTTQGNPWHGYSVRDVLSSPRYAGLVAPPRPEAQRHSAHNVSLGDLDAGTWEPLVSPETWAAARDLLADPARRTARGAQVRSLLSGVATCGLCGAGMKAGRTTQHALYRCGASAHLARKRDDADHYVSEVVIERLSRPDAIDLLADRDAPDLDRLRAELRDAQQGEANVAGMVARGLMSRRAAEGALLEVRRRIGELEAALSDAGKVDVLGPLVTGDARAVWQSLGGDRQRAVVRALMSVEMHSPGRGSRAPRDPARRLEHTAATVAIHWHE